MSPVKLYSVTGKGSPLAARETLLVSMLLELGYILHQGEGQKNYQDNTVESTGVRSFVFLFSCATAGQPVREVADHIVGVTEKVPGHLQWRRAVYAAYEPGKTPVRALNQLAAQVPAGFRKDFDRLLQYHEQLLKDLQTAPRHLEIHRGKCRFWVDAALTPEEREEQIKRLLAA